MRPNYTLRQSHFSSRLPLLGFTRMRRSHAETTQRVIANRGCSKLTDDRSERRIEGEESYFMYLQGSSLRVHCAGQALSRGDGVDSKEKERVTTPSCQGSDRLRPHGVSLQHSSGASPLVFFLSLLQLIHIIYRFRRDLVYVWLSSIR